MYNIYRKKVNEMTIGEKIRQLRKEKNMSQADLAMATGLSKGAISMYELNERNAKIETLEILADYFNVDMNFLTGRDMHTTLIASDEERLLVSKFRALNTEGQQKVLSYVADLVATGRYCLKCDQSEVV